MSNQHLTFPGASNWILFRLRQAFRLIHAAGWGMLVVALILTGVFWLQFFKWLIAADWWWTGLLAHASLAYLHLRRKDVSFLRQGAQGLPAIFLLDYSLLLLPWLVLLVVNGQWLSAVMASTAVVWAWAPVREGAATPFATPRWLNRFTHPQAYEWYVICRQYWMGIALAWLLFAGVMVHFGFFVAGVMVLLSGISAAFDYIAPAVMQPTDRRALLRHWRLSARSMHLALAPGYVLLLIFQTAWWPLLLYTALAAEGFLLCCLTGNALAWQPQRQRMYSIATSIFLVTLLVPGGLLVAWGRAIYQLWKFRSHH